MTALIATITPDAAWLSQDTLAAAPTGGKPAFGAGSVSSDAAACAASAFTGDGAPPEIAPLGFVSKIAVVPHLNIVAGAAGDYLAAQLWGQVLAREVPVDDIAELPAWAGAALADTMDIAGAEELMVVCLGWSQRLGRCAGYAFGAEDGFAPVELTEGHSFMPALDAAGRHYDEICETWTPACDGIEVERFHRLAALNQHDSFARGRFAAGRGIGGRLVTARVDANGIAVGPRMEYPGAEKLRRHIERDRELRRIERERFLHRTGAPSNAV